MFNILSMISFANGIFFLFIAIYSISADRHFSINRASALVCLFLSVWTLSYTFFMRRPQKQLRGDGCV